MLLYAPGSCLPQGHVDSELSAGQARGVNLLPRLYLRLLEGEKTFRFYRNLLKSSLRTIRVNDCSLAQGKHWAADC